MGPGTLEMAGVAGGGSTHVKPKGATDDIENDIANIPSVGAKPVKSAIPVPTTIK
jgi:hypothetical protein